MTRNKMIALLLFLLLLLIIICTWCHSDEIAEKRAMLASQNVSTPVSEVVEQSINYTLTKDKDEFELTGSFSNTSNVEKVHTALGINDLKDNSKIDDALTGNEQAIAVTQQLIPIFYEKYSNGSISFKDNQLTVEGTVPSVEDKNSISTLLANSTVLSINNTKVVFVPTDPIKFKIDKKNDLIAIQGVFNAQSNADELISTINSDEVRKNIAINSKLIEGRDVLTLTNTLIEPFKATYTEGFIKYENQLLTIEGTVESQTAKDDLEALLHASSIKYENHTQVVIPGPSDEELAAIAQQEADDKAAADALAKKEADEAQALKDEEAKASAEALAKKDAEIKAVQAEKIEVKIKKVIDLENINFEVNKARLTEKSIKTISHIASILKEYPEVSIEIGGHTDNTGQAAYNLSLSQKRVDTVKQSLISMDIDASRLTSIGYGITQPLVSNDTKENRRLNRRVEFKVKGE